MPSVTVFGGSQPERGDSDYEFAFELGKQLGQSGYTVLTGGYIGTMEAVSHGAFKAGAHVIGVTCEDIESWRPVGANPWVKEEIRTSSLPDRMIRLILGCDAALALPGGIGTLTEVMMTWNLMLTHSISSRPLILVGSIWHDFMDYYIQNFQKFIPEEQRVWASFAQDIDDIILQLQEKLSNGKV